MQRSNLTKTLAFVLLMTPMVVMSVETVDLGIPPVSPNNIPPQLATPNVNAIFGPVLHSDTLWSIAKKLASERGIPTNQMLAALREANQQAFIEGSANGLKLGAFLQIPGSGPKLELPKRKPLWKRRVNHKWKAPTQTEQKTPALTPSRDIQLTSKHKNIESIDQVPEQLINNAVITPLATPAVINLDKTNRDMVLDTQVRLDRLEKKVDAIQQLQIPPVQQPVALQVTQNLPVEQLVTGLREPVTPTDPSALYLPASGYVIGMLSVLGWQKWRKRKAKKKPVLESLFTATETTTPKTADIKPSPIAANWVTTEWMQEVGQRREQLPVTARTQKTAAQTLKPKESLPREQLPTSTKNPNIKPRDTSVKFPMEAPPHEFLTELNNVSAKQNAAEMLTKVDLYLAHGQYEKAEDLLYSVIQQMPGRDEYKLKLLQIYSSNGNKVQFATYVNELANAGRLNDYPFWGYVANMAQTIIPGSPLFSNQKPLGQKQQEPNKRALPDTGRDELEFDFDFAELPLKSNMKR